MVRKCECGCGRDANDLQTLKDVLDNQAERGIKSGDYDELSYETKRADKCTELKVSSLKVAFVFSQRGRLIGAYNWKE